MKALITPLGVLYLAVGFVNGCVALFLLLDALFPALIGVVAVNGASKGEEGALQAMVLMFGTSAAVGLFALVFAALGLAYLVDGIGLIARKPWARWLGIGLAVPLMFACMPVGMVFGLLGLLTLLLPDGAEAFAPADGQ